MKKTTTVLMERGTYILGRTQTDASGAVIKHQDPSWEAVHDGASIVVFPVSSQDRVQQESADIFPAWNGLSAVEEALKRLGLELNLPDLAAIWRNGGRDNVDICDYCEQYGQRCDNCYIKMKLTEEA